MTLQRFPNRLRLAGPLIASPRAAGRAFAALSACNAAPPPGSIERLLVLAPGTGV